MKFLAIVASAVAPGQRSRRPTVDAWHKVRLRSPRIRDRQERQRVRHHLNSLGRF